MDKWLEDGEQTKITPEIKKISEEISSNLENDCDLEYIFETLRWIKNNFELNDENKFEKNGKKGVFRRRTSIEIIEDGFLTGCTDFTLVYIPLARARGIPTKYLELVSKRWINKWKKEKERGKDKKRMKIKGHVVAKSKVNGNWYIVDPDSAEVQIDKKGNLKREDSSIFHRNMKILGEGKDSWDLGMRSLKDVKEFIYSNV